MIPIKSLFAPLFNFQPKTSPKNLEVVALTEGLDEFVEIEDSSLGVIEYLTVHGSRTLNRDRPNLNVFVVLKKGAGFALAISMPYIRSYNSKLGIPQLVVEYSQEDAPATLEGYAKAVDLPDDCREVYIEEMAMLDTDYAAMLANIP